MKRKISKALLISSVVLVILLIHAWIDFGLEFKHLVEIRASLSGALMPKPAKRAEEFPIIQVINRTEVSNGDVQVIDGIILGIMYNLTVIQVFSPFYDPRAYDAVTNRSSIHFVLAANDPGRNKQLWCLLCPSDDAMAGNCEITVADHSSNQVYLDNWQGLPYLGRTHRCRIAKAVDATHATIIAEDKQPTSAVQLHKIRGSPERLKPPAKVTADQLRAFKVNEDANASTENYPLDIRVCSGPHFGSQPLEMYSEWIEYNFLMGVSKIHFFLTPHLNPNVTAMLKVYKSMYPHRIYLFDWPSISDKIMHYHSQTAMNQHCVMETLDADFTANIDIDEYIGPADGNKGENWMQMFADQLADSDTNSMVFNTWFKDSTCLPFVSSKDAPPHERLLTEHAIYKEKAAFQNGRTKSLYRPREVAWTGIHEVYQYVGDRRKIPGMNPNTQGYLHHMTTYIRQKDCSQTTPGDRSVDKNLQKFAVLIKPKVKEFFSKKF